MTESIRGSLKNIDYSWRSLSEFPTEVLELSMENKAVTETIDMSYNCIREMPNEIGDFKNLTELNFRNNKIKKT